MIRGKTAEEALALKPEELAGELGPPPPMKIHCSQLVEGALRSRVESAGGNLRLKLRSSGKFPRADVARQFSKAQEGGVKIQFLD